MRVVKVLPQKGGDGARVIFVGAGEYMWVSADHGETVTPARNLGGFRGASAALKPHPTRADWLLALAKRPGCTAAPYQMMACPNDLLLSQDAYGALTWTNLTANAPSGQVAGFVDFDWAQRACIKGGGGACAALSIPDQAIFATLYAHAGDWDVAWDPDVHFARSDDLFKSFKARVACGNQFEVVGRELYLARANRCPTDMAGKPAAVDPTSPPGITLHTSLDGGGTFRQACLPVALKQEG